LRECWGGVYLLLMKTVRTPNRDCGREGEDSELSSRTSRRTLDGTTESLAGEVMPPLRDDEAGGWQDAACY